MYSWPPQLEIEEGAPAETKTTLRELPRSSKLLRSRWALLRPKLGSFRKVPDDGVYRFSGGVGALRTLALMTLALRTFPVKSSQTIARMLLSGVRRIARFHSYSRAFLS
jgi:hypothetical protein